MRDCVAMSEKNEQEDIHIYIEHNFWWDILTLFDSCVWQLRHIENKTTKHRITARHWHFSVKHIKMMSPRFEYGGRAFANGSTNTTFERMHEVESRFECIRLVDFTERTIPLNVFNVFATKCSRMSENGTNVSYASANLDVNVCDESEWDTQTHNQRGSTRMAFC